MVQMSRTELSKMVSEARGNNQAAGRVFRNFRDEQLKTHYSIIRIAGTISGGVITFAVQERSAFSYGLGGAIPGVTEAATAKRSHTSITTAFETLAGEDFLIHAVDVRRIGKSCAAVADLLAPHMSFALHFGDTKKADLGTMFDLGGLESGQAYAIAPAANQALTSLYVPNGGPQGGEERRVVLSQPELWTSKDGPNKKCSVIANLWEQKTITVANRAAVADAVLAWTAPAAAGDNGTYLDLMVRLHGTSSKKLVPDTDCCA